MRYARACRLGLCAFAGTFVHPQGSYPREGRERGELDFERLVDLYYGPLYRFALSLTRTDSDACDLTQETFHIWAAKGHQLLDASKVKTWLFTTLHRLFLESQRRPARFPHFELEDVSDELPSVEPALVDRLDAGRLVELLARVEEPYQAPVALFYLEDYSYQEIAGILRIPLGTVKSRIARGLAQLKHLLLQEAAPGASGRKTP